MKKLAFVDIETTGTNYYRDRIIDIGVVTYEDGKEKSHFTTLINPGMPVNPYIHMMTGITREQLQAAPEFNQVAQHLAEILSDHVFVAHNVRFDYGFIKREFDNVGLKFSMPHLCSVVLSRKLFPTYRKHNLDSIIERFDISIPQRHRALPDAMAIGKFFEKTVDMFGLDTLTDHMKNLLRAPKYPPNLDKSIVDKLPHCPGVYIMYGKENEVLYVGKSIDIKDRVISHFYQDINSTRELAVKSQTHFIESYPTAGELEALLLESELIKKLSPIYNRKLRRRKVLWAAIATKNKKGYTVIEIQRVKNTITPEDSNYLLMATNKKSLINSLNQRVKNHMLCSKLSGITKSTGACFNYQIGKCLGACIGIEPKASYNERVKLAFKDSLNPEWPYTGPVAIPEHNLHTKKSSFHIIFNWQFIKTVNSLADIDNLNAENSNPPDTDTVKIIQKYFKDVGSHRVINLSLDNPTSEYGTF